MAGQKSEEEKTTHPNQSSERVQEGKTSLLAAESTNPGGAAGREERRSSKLDGQQSKSGSPEQESGLGTKSEKNLSPQLSSGGTKGLTSVENSKQTDEKSGISHLAQTVDPVQQTSAD